MRLSDDSYFGLPSYCEELFSFQSFKPKYVCLDFIDRKDTAAVVAWGVGRWGAGGETLSSCRKRRRGQCGRQQQQRGRNATLRFSSGDRQCHVVSLRLFSSSLPFGFNATLTLSLSFSLSLFPSLAQTHSLPFPLLTFASSFFPSLSNSNSKLLY